MSGSWRWRQRRGAERPPTRLRLMMIASCEFPSLLGSVASFADCLHGRGDDEGEEQQRERDEAPPTDRGVGALVVGHAACREGDGCERADGHRCAMKTTPEHLPLLVRRTFVLH